MESFGPSGPALARSGLSDHAYIIASVAFRPKLIEDLPIPEEIFKHWTFDYFFTRLFWADRIDLLEGFEAMQVCEIKEPRAIYRLKVVPQLENTIEQNALREIIFSIKWDNERKPSVWTPLGDFFATAPGINYFRSLPVGMTDGGFYSNWYMPFNQAQIEFKNEGKTAYTLDFQIHPNK